MLYGRERYYQACNSEIVEDEKHFLLYYPAFTAKRQKLLSTVSKRCNDMSNDEKIILLVSGPNAYRFTAKACHIILQSRKHVLFINPLDEDPFPVS